jgi:hypothetical protein
MSEPTQRTEWLASELRIAIGRALLASSGPLTSAELEPYVSAHQSNVKKEAERMASAGLIRGGIRRPRSAGKRGPQPESFGLSPEQRNRATSDLGRGAPPGLLQRGQEIVAVSTSPGQTVDLLQALNNAEATARATWVAMLGEDLLVAYSGPDAAGPAFELQAVLEAADIPSRRTTVARLLSGADWAREGRKLVRAINRARVPHPRSSSDQE